MENRNVGEAKLQDESGDNGGVSDPGSRTNVSGVRSAPESDDVYPSPPPNVPENLSRPGAAYKRHAWLAGLGLVSFVGLYLFLVAWFARSVYRCFISVRDGGDDVLKMLLVGGAALLLTVFLVKAFFAVQKGQHEGYELKPSDQPKLFSFLHRLADETGAPRPHRVFLSTRVNAAVFYDLSFFNLLFPSKKNLEIGLGLVNTLTLSELKAVLAHEFGHFAQRSMAVGRWVYVAQQIAASIVSRRDWFDSVLNFLSGIDLRIAWFGWLMRIIVWSVRAVLDTAFSVVVLAQRALSREMEFQADLVAVASTGSDALVHALHRLTAADSAFDRAVAIAASEMANGRKVPDLFTLQSRVAERMRDILDDATHGCPPELPAQHREAHRVFEEQMAQAPRMWSTHPSNREREDNAKRNYVAAELDDRPAWTLFRDAAKLRRELTERLLAQVGRADAKAIAEEQALAAVEERFGSIAFERCYRGAYLGRSAVLGAANPAELVQPLQQGQPFSDVVASLYPHSLADLVERWRNLEGEVNNLSALQHGVLTAPGGVIRHRGQTLKRRDLPASLEQATSERDELRAELKVHDRLCRSAAQAAAQAVGNGWAEYHYSLVQLLHYAGHAEADVEDAKGHLVNVFSVVVADGRVSGAERRRLVRAAAEVHAALWAVKQAAQHVVLPARVAEKLEVASWTEALPDDFELPAPAESNISDWMQVIDGWSDAFEGPLGLLERATLEALLEAERAILDAHAQQQTMQAAPALARVPAQYPLRTIGTERERQRRLDWWDRFMTADGLVPTLGRFVVSGAIVGGVLAFSGSDVSVPVSVYNGLQLPVVVNVADQQVRVLPNSSAELSIVQSAQIELTARTDAGELIEVQRVAVDGAKEHVYNVGGAAPLVEWVADYGTNVERANTLLGASTWQAVDSDYVLTEPPESIRTKSGPTTRDVLSALSGVGPGRMLSAVEDERQRASMILTHVEWDLGSAHHILSWLAAASELEEYGAVLERRLRHYPSDLPALRAQQELVPEGVRAAVCEAQLSALRAANADPGTTAYIEARCAPRSERRSAFIAAHEQHRDNAWLAAAAGHEFAEMGQFQKSAEVLRLAISSSPPTVELAAPTLARVQRLQPELGIDLKQLAEQSQQLQRLLQLESGEELPAGYRAYAELGRGQLDQAVVTAGVAPELLPYVVRFAAASDGASADLMQQADELSPDAGLNANSVWAAIGCWR